MIDTKRKVFIEADEFVADLRKAEKNLTDLVVGRDDIERIRLSAKAHAFNEAVIMVEEGIVRHGDDTDAIYCDMIAKTVTAMAPYENFTADDIANLADCYSGSHTEAKLKGWVEGCRIVLDRIRIARGK